MKRAVFYLWTFVASVVLCGLVPREASARIDISDCFYLAGFFREEVAFHTAQKNPYNTLQTENNDLNLARTFLQLELTYQPSSAFKFYTKFRVTGDTTNHWDSKLGDYNAFPYDVPKGDWTMLKVSEDDWRAEIWEMYTDVSVGNLWLRLGKQPISWGEMIGLRLMDQINALETNWHLTNEPEEYENIRIPNWSIRGIYQVGAVKGITDTYLEGYINPGDVTPTVGAPFGSPYNTSGPFPAFFKIDDKDKRGKTEFGFRAGGMFKNWYATLAYLKVYADSFKFQHVGFTPDPVHGLPFFAARGDMTRYSLLIDKMYPQLDIYGLTLNYDIPQPIGSVMTWEATWTPKQPFGDRTSAFPNVVKTGELGYSVRFDRPTAVLPRLLFNAPVEMMAITLQFAQYIREGDPRRLYGPGNSHIEKTQELIVLQFKQPFWYSNITAGIQFMVDLDDAYQIKPSLQYKHSTDWYVDVVGLVFSGAQKQAGRLGYLDYTNEVYVRFTYQF